MPDDIPANFTEQQRAVLEQLRPAGEARIFPADWRLDLMTSIAVYGDIAGFYELHPILTLASVSDACLRLSKAESENADLKSLLEIQAIGIEEQRVEIERLRRAMGEISFVPHMHSNIGPLHGAGFNQALTHVQSIARAALEGK